MDSEYQEYIEILKKLAIRTKDSLFNSLKKSEKFFLAHSNQPENEKRKMYLSKKLKLISENLEVLKNLPEEDIINFALSTESNIMAIACNQRLPIDLRMKARVVLHKPLSKHLGKMKKKLNKAMESESKGETQAEAPKTLDKVTLNKQIVNMRNIIKQAKVHIIHKLTRKITKLRESKGPEKRVEKNQRKASRLVKKVKCIMNLDEDEVSKFALPNTQDLVRISTNIKMPMRTQALATIAVHKIVKASVTAFRKAFPGWHKIVPKMLNKKNMKKRKLNFEVKENVKSSDEAPNKKSKISSNSEDKVNTSSNGGENSSESDHNNESDQDIERGKDNESDQDIERGKDNESDQDIERDKDNESDVEGRKENTKNEHKKDEEMSDFNKNGSNIEAKEDDASVTSERLSTSVSNSLDNKVLASLMSKRKTSDSKSNNKKKTNKTELKSNVYNLNKMSSELSKNNSNFVTKSIDSMDKEISSSENKSIYNIQTTNNRSNLNKRKPERNEFTQTKKRCKDLALNKKKDILVNAETNKKRISNKKENLKEISKPKINKSTSKVVDPFFMTTTNEEYITSQVPVVDKNTQSSWKNEKEYSRTRLDKFNKFENKSKWSTKNEGNWKKNNFNNRENHHYKKPLTNRFEKTPNVAGKFTNTLGNRKERRKALNQPPQVEKVEKLHPSWEAKKKQTAITSFQGKKVTFD